MEIVYIASWDQVSQSPSPVLTGAGSQMSQERSNAIDYVSHREPSDARFPSTGPISVVQATQSVDCVMTALAN